VRLLIVDDDPSVREVVRIVLGAAGHEIVDTAADGASAVAAARAHRPDGVVLDVTLPDMDGGALLRILVDVLPGARVVMYSGHDDRDVADELRAAGAFAVLVKGGDPDELLEAFGEA
jgi:DNA-binding NarL/FixJ family response regulator